MIRLKKIVTGQNDDYTTGCLLDYPYFEKYCKLHVIDLSKQQKLDADPEAIKQLNFTGNLDKDGHTIILCITEEAKEAILNFFHRKL